VGGWSANPIISERKANDSGHPQGWIYDGHRWPPFLYHHQRLIQVPLLGSIPVLGSFSELTGKEAQTTNLIIFITARTVNPRRVAE